MNILVTGGAGFIGSHTTDELLKQGHNVRIIDNLSKPVHLKGRPDYISDQVEFIEGDVRNKDLMLYAMKDIDVVYHLAAYQDYLTDFSTFFSVNSVSTALIYELIVQHRLPVKKVIVASSQAVAGEGRYQDPDGNDFAPDIRAEENLSRGIWDITDSSGRLAQWQPTPESFRNPQNQYALSKVSEEDIALRTGKRFGIPSVAMRYSIVQGARQSFYNAYSGACRIFSLATYFDKAPIIYEDGGQIRDYVNIHDVVDANIMVMNSDDANFRTFNVGGGTAYSVLDFYSIVTEVFGKAITPNIPGFYRFGDTRHIFSDTSALQSLGWKAKRTPKESVTEYVEYLNQQTDIDDILDYAEKKMKSLNVVRKAGKQ